MSTKISLSRALNTGDISTRRFNSMWITLKCIQTCAWPTSCQQASNFDQRPASKIDQGTRGYLRFLNR